MRRHDTDHLCQYRQDSKPQQGFAERGRFPREGSWLAQQPADQSWFHTPVIFQIKSNFFTWLCHWLGTVPCNQRETSEESPKECP